jgi:hypothetical protein
MVTDFLKVNGVKCENVNDLHCPTIRCPFNVNTVATPTGEEERRKSATESG